MIAPFCCSLNHSQLIQMTLTLEGKQIMSTTPEIQFFFESNHNHGYVGVLANSELVSGAIVSQDAGSTNPGIYYQVGGGGLNGAFDAALGAQVNTVNKELQTAYDKKFGAGSWDKDSNNPPSPLPLTSLLVPVSPAAHVGDKITGIVYSVGPILTSAGLTPAMRSVYTQIYVDAMNQIAANSTKIDGFRITILSSSIYRGNAPIAPFADAAAGCIIDAVRTAVKAQPTALGNLAILINTNANAAFPVELNGFTNAATALGVKVTAGGFSIPVT